MATASYPKDPREVLESPIIQGAWEALAYTFNFANCDVTTVEGQSVAVVCDEVDVTSTVMPGVVDPPVDLVLTTPKLTGLTAGKIYYMYGRVTHDGGQKTELLCRVFAKA